jgi:hypothetical protein
VIGETRHVLCETSNKYSEADICYMIGFLVDTIHVVFQQSVGIPMGTNCAPLLADLFSYSEEFVQKLLRDKNKKYPCPSIIHTVRAIISYLSIIILFIINGLHLIYPDELEINDRI